MFFLIPCTDFVNGDDAQKLFDSNCKFYSEGLMRFTNKYELIREFGRGWYVYILYDSGTKIARVSV